MKLSYSRVDCFKQCPYKYNLRYRRKIKMLPTYDPQDPLILGHALHTGIEKNIQLAIDEYYNSYPIITDNHINEAIKLEYWLLKIEDLLPNGFHEIEIIDNDFLGYIDLLVPTYEENNIKHFDLYDFKYSNNIDTYKESEQLHLYKYYSEKESNVIVDNLYFMFVPKCFLKIKYKNKTNPKDESLNEFRKRIFKDLESKDIKFVKIDYNPNKVIDFLTDSKHLLESDTYDKCISDLCRWCEYQGYCERGEDIDMQLPSTQRRNIEGNGYKKIWIYGLPFSGKTYLANQFDTPLMLNTDGNFKQVDAPVLRIVDEVTTEGRITKRKYAWEVFSETVDELEKGSDFKTIIVDLLEDVYDACRIKVCVDNGWDHESDDSFKAYDIVRSEFLRTLKRLLNLNYNIVLISHEDTSRDIMKKTGDKITAIKPNLPEKIALKVAGMVDICCRIKNDDGKRTISFKSSEVEFGGGRLEIKAKEIECKYTELMKVYGDENGTRSDRNDKEEFNSNETSNNSTNAISEQSNKDVETSTAIPTGETPERKVRVRKPRENVETTDAPTVNANANTDEEAEEAEKPVRRRRRVSE